MHKREIDFKCNLLPNLQIQYWYNTIRFNALIGRESCKTVIIEPGEEKTILLFSIERVNIENSMIIKKL